MCDAEGVTTGQIATSIGVNDQVLARRWIQDSKPIFAISPIMYPQMKKGPL